MASRFGYSVMYDGVGDPPQGQEHVGHCTQIAKFVRISEHKAACDNNSTPYTLVSILTSAKYENLCAVGRSVNFEANVRSSIIIIKVFGVGHLLGRYRGMGERG